MAALARRFEFHRFILHRCYVRGNRRSRPARDLSSAPDGYIGVTLIKVDPDSSRRGLDHFGIHVESLDAMLERLSRVEPGVEIKRPDRAATTSEYKVRDPDGNVFDISESGWT
jgi:hypothetical protein